jgi:hypothetical protein
VRLNQSNTRPSAACQAGQFAKPCAPAQYRRYTDVKQMPIL